MGISIHFEGTAPDVERVNQVILGVRGIAEVLGIDNTIIEQEGHVYKSVTRQMFESREDEELKEEIESLKKDNDENWRLKTATREDIRNYWKPPFTSERSKYEPGKAVILENWSWTFAGEEHPISRQIDFDKLKARGDAYHSVERGIILHPAPNLGTLNICFHRRDDGSWKIREHMKTQSFNRKEVSRNLRVHVLVVHVLEFIKDYHLPELEIDDEGDYYFTEEQRAKHIKRWKRELENPESVYHSMAPEMLNYWKTIRPHDPHNILKAYGECTQVMEDSMRMFEGLGYSREDIEIGVMREIPLPEEMKSIATTYTKTMARDEIKNGDERMEILRPRKENPEVEG